MIDVLHNSTDRNNDWPTETLIGALCACSVIFSNIMSSLPTGGEGSSIFHGSDPGATGLLNTNEDFYTWLNQSVLATLYVDAVCGNNICESPEEVPGVGRFGWSLHFPIFF